MIPLILAFAPPSDRELVLSTARGLGAVLYFKEPPDAPLEPPPEHVLLGVGPAGCASLAAYVSERGLDGVRAIGLVGPSAPWAELRDADPECPGEHCKMCNGEACDKCGAGCWDHNRFLRGEPRCEHDVDQRHEGEKRHAGRLPLGPLEALRGPAERSRSGEPCRHPACMAFGNECIVYPLRLVLAVCPEATPCEACGGDGRLGYVDRVGQRLGDACAACSGTGRALSSAEVASELLGRQIPENQSSDGDGGLQVFQWHRSDHARLVEFALPMVLALAMEER